MAIFLRKEFETAIPKECKEAIYLASDAASKFKISIFLIGGIVRDLIIGNEIKDIDIAVEGDAVEFAKILEKDFGCEILNIQENLRTSKVSFTNGCVIDFASTREEKYIDSGILPVAYNFGCKLEQDIKRRDFTINTLALSLVGDDKYSLVDYCGGYEDVLNKKIRILHKNSFIDDPSRIIRALKFKIRFSFDYEEETYLLMQNYLDNISNSMPLERIKGELKQYFCIKNENLYDELIATNSYKLISDSVKSSIDYKKISLFNFKKSELWFVYLVLLVINSSFAIERLNLTSIEKNIIKEVQNLLSDKLQSHSNYEIYKRFSNLQDLSIKIYYVLTDDTTVLKFYDELKHIKVEINGKDLIQLGFKPSPLFNEIFDKILREKIEGKFTSKEDEIEFIKNSIKKEE